MNEIKFKASEVGSVLTNTAVASVGAWHTAAQAAETGFASIFTWGLPQIAMASGAFCGIATCIVNIWLAVRRDEREARALEAGLEKRAGATP